MKEGWVNTMIWIAGKIRFLVQNGVRYLLQDMDIYNVAMAVMVIFFFVSFWIKKYYLQLAFLFASAIEGLKERRIHSNLMMSCCGGKSDL